MSTVPTADDAVRWLAQHEDGAAPDEALALFDGLPAVEVQDLAGRWRGSGLPMGSPLDGLLEAYGWYGKEFLDEETVHPLLFRDRTGQPRPLDPAFLPVPLIRTLPSLAHGLPARLAFAAARPLLATRRSAARTRMLVHRGVLTAAMVYDRQPIIDVFRRVSADVLLGAMDLRGLPTPFLFVLRRDVPAG
jgi:hypothetical protein